MFWGNVTQSNANVKGAVVSEEIHQKVKVHSSLRLNHMWKDSLLSEVPFYVKLELAYVKFSV